MSKVNSTTTSLMPELTKEDHKFRFAKSRGNFKIDDLIISGSSMLESINEPCQIHTIETGKITMKLITGL